MGIVWRFGRIRTTLLGTAVSLLVSGFVSLAVVGNQPTSMLNRVLAPSNDSSTPFTSDSLLVPSTSTPTTAAERASVWVSGAFIDTPSDPSTTGAPPPESPPTTAPTPTEVKAGVPAAGTQASVGTGPGSCTDVGITALKPDSCPPASGSGPVTVEPSSSPIVTHGDRTELSA